MAFSFGFSGDDIEASHGQETPASSSKPILTSSAPSSAFPVPGKPQLPPTHHAVSELLARLPSKIAYGLLDVDLDDGSRMQIPRRELWDVRVQIMAEDDHDREGGGTEGLGDHDVRTGVYEGGFKSWESSVDLVKVLAVDRGVLTPADRESPLRVVELGCGTALPSLALFQWAMDTDSQRRRPVSLTMADYNPTVLQLVTLPNFLLAWALQHPESPALHDAFSIEGELELSTGVLDAFQDFLRVSRISLAFISGAWSPEFVQLVYGNIAETAEGNAVTTILIGAETIYSPFALQAFTETIFSILQRESATAGAEAAAFVGAKRLYFGVGGSLDDFIEKACLKGAAVTQLREETEGVRRGVVRCALANQSESQADTPFT